MLSLAVAAQVLAATAQGGETATYRRTVALYEVPDVTLVNQDGERVRLREELATDKPVLFDFFFATCTTVCPVLSAGFSTLLRSLGPQARGLRVVSLAIDPDHDTPGVLREYRQQFRGGAEWELLTGSRADVDRVRKAFDAYTPDKVTHRPLSFLRAARADSWVRIDGLISASELKAEYRALSRP